MLNSGSKDRIWPRTVSGWVSLGTGMGLLVTGMIMAVVQLYGLDTVIARDTAVESVRIEVQGLERQVLEIGNVVQCLLWEVPAERCAAARRP